MSTRPRILVVEDEKLWIDNYRGALRDLAVDIEEAGTATRAVTALGERAWALAIIDLEIGGTKGDVYGGFEVLEVAEGANPYTELVVITAHRELEVQERVAKYRVPVVLKPIDWREFFLLARGSIGVWERRLRVLRHALESFPTTHALLSNRKHNRPDFKIANEYDLQDLLHVTLKPFYPDIVPEEHGPNRGGSEKRLDFVIKGLDTVIETKMVRNASHAKSIADELDIDIRNYPAHPRCSLLICYVYDPKRFIKDPKKIECDLSGETTQKGKTIDAQVMIRSS
jgi:CheY-like chemotaxis protein